jgi:hypothetical protein
MVPQALVEIYGGVLRYPIVSGMTGILKHPENSIVITNNRIYLLSIPFPGYNVYKTASTARVMARESIGKKAEAIFRNQNINQFVAARPNENSVFEKSSIDIEFKGRFLGFLGMLKFIVKTPDGKKIKIGIYKKDDFESIKRALGR